MPRINVTAGVLLVGTLSPGCSEPSSPADPATRCGWSAPHRLFKHNFGQGELEFGLTSDKRSLWHDIPGDLFYSSAKVLHTSSYCGEDLAPLRASDGLLHLHAGLAIDCLAGVVLRGDSDDTLEPVYEGAACHLIATPEGILGAARAPDDDVALIPLRLLDFRAPDLPVLALSDEPVMPLAEHVGPRDGDRVGQHVDRLQTGHFASPYLMLTVTGEVLHVDRDTWATTKVLDDVESLVPSPDGRAFAYRSRLADGSAGDLRVRVLASGEEHVAAAADEDDRVPRPWWSVDGALFAAPIVLEGRHHERVLSLQSGTSAVTPASARVQHELDGEALWLTARESTTDLEYYWEPLTGVTRALHEHAAAPTWYRRATADGLEIIDVPQSSFIPEHEPGTLMHVPWDGSAPTSLAEGVSPWYRRIADGRVLTIESSRGLKPDRPVDLVLIDGDQRRVIDRSLVALETLRVSDGDQEGGFFRVAGDLLIYAVRDDVGPRSGVWGVDLSRL